MDRIRCQQCKAESYNEFGKTSLVCMTCYKKLETQIKSHEAVQVGLNKQVADLQTKLDEANQPQTHTGS